MLLILLHIQSFNYQIITLDDERSNILCCTSENDSGLCSYQRFRAPETTSSTGRFVASSSYDFYEHYSTNIHILALSKWTFPPGLPFRTISIVKFVNQLLLLLFVLSACHVTAANVLIGQSHERVAQEPTCSFSCDATRSGAISCEATRSDALRPKMSCESFHATRFGAMRREASKRHAAQDRKTGLRNHY